MPTSTPSLIWAFAAACAALLVILGGLAVALVVYQRRFLAMHRAHAEALLRTQEQERAWVAQEVHDDALQRIMLMLHELDDIAGQVELVAPGATGDIRSFRAELEDLSADLRQLAYRLHPAFVEQEGVVPMLERLTADVERAARVNIELRADVANGTGPSLDSEQSLIVYRIAQEALNNIVRHAASPRAVVEVRAKGDLLELRVEDFGRGFDVVAARRAGLGLLSMTERARSAGGLLLVASEPGNGTRIHLKLPVRAAS